MLLFTTAAPAGAPKLLLGPGPAPAPLPPGTAWACAPPLLPAHGHASLPTPAPLPCTLPTPATALPLLDAGASACGWPCVPAAHASGAHMPELLPAALSALGATALALLHQLVCLPATVSAGIFPALLPLLFVCSGKCRLAPAVGPKGVRLAASFADPTAAASALPSLPQGTLPLLLLVTALPLLLPPDPAVLPGRMAPDMLPPPCCCRWCCMSLDCCCADACHFGLLESCKLGPCAGLWCCFC